MYNGRHAQPGKRLGSNRKRKANIEKIVGMCLQLDRAWARDFGRIHCTGSEGSSDAVACAAYTAARLRKSYAAAAAAAHAAKSQGTYDAYNAHNAYAAYVDDAQGVRCDRRAAYQAVACAHGDALDRAAVHVMWAYAVGCVGQGGDVARRIKKGLHFVGSDEALDEVAERVECLQRDCEAWKREQRQRRQRLLIMTLGGAVACGLGMVLPVLWGAVVPWAWVLVGACAGGILGHRAALSRTVASKATWMLMAGAIIGLGAGGVSWVAWSLVAGVGTAVAVGTGAKASYAGGLRGVWGRAASAVGKLPVPGRRPA